MRIFCANNIIRVRIAGSRANNTILRVLNLAANPLKALKLVPANNSHLIRLNYVCDL